MRAYFVALQTSLSHLSRFNDSVPHAIPDLRKERIVEWKEHQRAVNNHRNWAITGLNCPIAKIFERYLSKMCLDFADISASVCNEYS